MPSRALALLAIATTFLAAEGIAQNPGDAIVVGKKNAQNTAELIAIDRSGVTTGSVGTGRHDHTAGAGLSHADRDDRRQ